MDLQIHQILGYVGLFVGSILEGETVVSDWSWIILGRKNGQNFINRKPRLRDKVVKIDRILNRRPLCVLRGIFLAPYWRPISPDWSIMKLR